MVVLFLNIYISHYVHGNLETIRCFSFKQSYLKLIISTLKYFHIFCVIYFIFIIIYNTFYVIVHHFIAEAKANYLQTEKLQWLVSAICFSSRRVDSLTDCSQRSKFVNPLSNLRLGSIAILSSFDCVMAHFSV